MSLKDLLVVVDHARNCGRRIDLAARLARDFEAHLTGLYVTTLPYLQPAVLAEFLVDFRDVHSRALREAAARAHGLFAERVEGAGFALATEWRDDEGDVADQVSLHARYADLTVIGQADPDDDAPLGSSPDLPERLVLAAGRPVLVVPYAGRF